MCIRDRLHSSLLDRSRPLWEFYVIEGLADGRLGFYSKVHHSAVDGQAAVAMANSIFDLTPEPRRVKPPRAVRSNRYQLGVAELLTSMKRDVPGTVKFLFQPAEESPPVGEEGGAPLMIKEGALQNPVPIAIYGLHVMPAIPLGEVMLVPGPFMASVLSLIHISEPTRPY